MNFLKNKKNFFMLFLYALIIEGCRDKAATIKQEDYNQVRNQMVEVNLILVRKDRQKIMEYIARQNITMKETGTGLWYLIENAGSGEKTEQGKVATINYKITLLDGTICYDSEKDGPKTFLIGKGGVESGLEEGILMLREGGTARFIMPPHLAYGLPGDGEIIPARAIIVYDVELISIR
jgi:FKBP-type peptidyl-prolyl cis-trans isomerase